MSTNTEDKTEEPPPTKRARKSASTFRPEAYDTGGPQVKIYKGKGTLLKEIDSIQEYVNSLSMNAVELLAAHKFLYSYRGKVNKRVLKEQILNFSGYLKDKDGNDEDEIEAFNDDMEKKMSIKAFKLTVAEIKNLCDTFDVDRSAEGGKSLGKDDLIDRLLDFLGKPEKKSTKTQQKKSSKKKAATSSSSSKEEKVEKGKMPSDKALRKWVQAYVACFNLDKATTKHAMETASEKFGIDLSEKKSRIKELLAEEM